jgi:hypothetical protein
MGGHGCAGAEGGRTPSPFSTVIAGLDPAIHRFLKKDGCAGQARA